MNRLAALINQEGSLGFGEACIYAFVGFALIFVGILLIILIIQFIGFIMKKTNNLAFLSAKKPKKSKKSKKTDSVEKTAESVSDDGDVPDEIKAAIVAALMAYYTAESPECEFKVKRIRRI